MKVVKDPVKYKSLSIPEPLFNEFKKYVQSNPNYRNMAEFLRQSIREKMQRDISAMAVTMQLEDTLVRQEEYIEQLKEMSPEEFIKMKEKREEKWNKNHLEYTKEHGTEWQVKDLKKRMKQTYKREKRELPDFLSDEKKFTTFVDNIITKRLEEKEKKELS